ncbi:2-Hydroxyacid oxidase 2 isoform X5 [Carettochelys insculpta]|uniref:2-Hydroxyacid oxidase 2 isoform X5 n=1 Tax=Carettochelys insculpta TaxID=44489 RepID=UPI003EB91804
MPCGRQLSTSLLHRRRSCPQGSRAQPLTLQHPAPRLTRQRLWSYPTSTDWWERLVLGEWDNDRWLRNFRMSRQTFLELCQWLTPALRHQDMAMRRALTVQKWVGIAVWKLATPDSYRSVGQQFGVSKATVGAVLMEVVRAINAMLLHRLVRLGDPDATIAAFATLGFPNCFGALDGTHIPICTPHHSGGRYLNRKGYHSVVLQALVDSRGRFQDIYVCWPGSTHDARVFRNSGLCRRLEAGTYIPQREIPLGDTTMPFCIIADAAYPLRPWLMHPYTGHLSASQERFNERLNHVRQVVECSFGRLKGRWRCLLTHLDAGPNNIPLIVGACCALHNLVESKGETFFQGWAAEAGRADVQPPAAPGWQVDPEGTRVREALWVHFNDEAAG